LLISWGAFSIIRRMKSVLAGMALVLVGCASGGTTFEPPDPQPDSPEQPPPDSGTEIPLDSTVNPPPDMALPPDSTVLPPDTAPPPPDACVAVATEVLANPSLDLTPNGTGWTEVLIQGLAGGPYPIITADGLTPVSAPNKAWMGGASGQDAGQGSVTDQLFQTVTFPADATDFVVTGMFAVGGIEVTTVVFDTFALDITELDGTVIENVLALNNTMPAAAFVPFSKTLSSNLAGRTVRFRATSTNDISEHTNFFLDSFSFKGTFCPP
jgi:hypothetical protein